MSQRVKHQARIFGAWKKYQRIGIPLISHEAQGLPWYCLVHFGKENNSLQRWKVF